MHEKERDFVQFYIVNQYSDEGKVKTKRKKMKFASKYREFVKEQSEELPVVQVKKLKKILKNCAMKNQVSNDKKGSAPCDCHYHCPGY